MPDNKPGMRAWLVEGDSTSTEIVNSTPPEEGEWREGRFCEGFSSSEEDDVAVGGSMARFARSWMSNLFVFVELGGNFSQIDRKLTKLIKHFVFEEGHGDRRLYKYYLVDFL